MGAGVEWPPVMVNGQPVMAGGVGPLEEPPIAEPAPPVVPWYRRFLDALDRHPAPPPAPRRHRRRRKKTALAPSRERVCAGPPVAELPALAARHAEAIARWDAACAAPVAPRRRPRGSRGTRTEYRPLFNGVLDADPLDVCAAGLSPDARPC